VFNIILTNMSLANSTNSAAMGNTTNLGTRSRTRGPESLLSILGYLVEMNVNTKQYNDNIHIK